MGGVGAIVQFQEEFPNPCAQLPRVFLQCCEELSRRRQLHPEEDHKPGLPAGKSFPFIYSADQRAPTEKTLPRKFPVDSAALWWGQAPSYIRISLHPIPRMEVWENDGPGLETQGPVEG